MISDRRVLLVYLRRADWPRYAALIAKLNLRDLGKKPSKYSDDQAGALSKKKLRRARGVK